MKRKPKTGIPRPGWKKALIQDKYLYIMLLPFVMYYLIFIFKPMYGLIIAFQDYRPAKGITGSDWVGMKNFMTFFQGPYFARTLKNTVMISLYSIIFNFPVPVILALMLNEIRGKAFKKCVQTVSYLPHFISIVVVAGILISFLSPSSGVINLIRTKLGLESVYFLTKKEYFRTIYTLMNMWKDSGFNAVIYIAALAGVNQELYEACKIDGGNRWRQTWHVTLPGIQNTIIIMLIMRVGSILQVSYEAIILLYQPATYETADVINTYIYRVGLAASRPDFSQTTAVGLVNSLVGLALVAGANYLGKKYSEVSLW
jgi:putative aldouronate transport system permease protein